MILKVFWFVDPSDNSTTKVMASSFDFAYLIFCNCFGFYEVESCTTNPCGQYVVLLDTLSEED